MLNQFSRTELLFGKEAMEHLSECRVAVFGIGGVGGYVCEALARSGVGAFDLIDDDKVCLTNINRQIIATQKTVGQYKVDVMKERILDINPKAEVNTYKCFFLPENASDFPFDKYDYVVDAIDTVTAKIEVDPLAKVMRRELKKRGVKNLKVVYSEEEPVRPVEDMTESQSDCESERPDSKRRSIPGSTAFVPSVAGLIIAGEVIKDLTR